MNHREYCHRHQYETFIGYKLRTGPYLLMEYIMKLIFTMLFSLYFFSGPAIADEVGSSLFNKIDKNADGKISKQEFVGSSHHEVNRKKVIQFFPGFKDLSSMQEDEYRSRLFDAMDMDKNGLLDKEEWHKIAPNILELRF
jgi:hypothetical protein